MANTITVDVVADVARLNRGVDQANSKLSSIGGAASKMAKVLGVAFAAKAAFDFGKAIVKSASDSQQSIGATETVFGKFSDTVIKTSKAAADKYGLSANVYRENANVLGALLKNQGVGLDQLGAKTQKYIGVGSDLAATFGGTTTEAVQALSSALKGEFDPLERYGISLKQSTINAELAARGQDKLKGAARAQAQQQVVSDLVMKQSKDSLGAFGRESDTLAHQQQVLGAHFDNIKTKLGSFLLPILTKLAGFIIAQVLPAMARLGAWIQANVLPVLQRFGAYLQANVLPVLQRLGAFVQTSILPILRRFGQYIISTVVPALVRLGQYIATKAQPVIRQLATTFRSQILPTLQRAYAKFQQLQPAILRIATVAGKVIGFFIRMQVAIASRVLPVLIRFAGFIFARVVPAVVRMISITVKVINKIIDFAGALKRGVSAAASFAKAVVDKIGKVIGFIRDIPSKAKSALGNLGGILAGAGRALIDGLIGGIKDKFQDVQNLLGSLTKKLPDWKGPADVDRTILRGSGQLVIDGLIGGIASRRSKLRAELGAVTDEIRRFQAPRLELAGATQLRTGTAGQLARGGNSYSINVRVERGASLVEVGRSVVEAIEAFEGAGGRRLAVR